MGYLFGGLVALSVVLVLGGLVSLSQATSGAGTVAAACYVAIMARIVQAAIHRR